MCSTHSWLGMLMLAIPWKRCEEGISGGGKFWPETGFATCRKEACKAHTYFWKRHAEGPQEEVNSLTTDATELEVVELGPAKLSG